MITNSKQIIDKKVMGILNVTPDSFFVKSRKQVEKEIVERVIQIVEEGAYIIDVGGYSSRPNALFVSEEEETKRLQFSLKILFRELPNAIVSIDTFRSKIVRKCTEKFRISIINDISAGELDTKMPEVVAELKVIYLIMHMRGTPQTMMKCTQYNYLLPEILSYFEKKINFLHQKGIYDIWIDPGFGFSKTTSQNYEILSQLNLFSIFNLPIVAGLSRKTMIRETIGVTTENALNGTTALNMFALTQGVNILRVHDVKEAVQTIQLYNQIQQYD
ncbi:MAG: dihydropteroate synthase [Candidatus Azobacteroides pseudotrichonymphae]|jgi:dihydropteroate synthase|uniref:dihydropteroate synthase n=1 Tax=Azobacteroides pseudotrichonymphae genomovar. CFP2 TaxID=511995 RepID=B6YQ56_AZOPC|nr:dihydropteroate synthase [Candidatus Azobacteroides pseudotrichonymphae]MDR0530120.1 dihydropteroate synthase [Bacteroidales bacterium OttesenSCG-928-I14]BAG83328.1 dihydropteroate synthase [Candidatus Azobacteroides pseudotrichonymphae genomovar. CFP2]GMO37043.1 MAG: dihydropteroate synthase [Candidatus Azobacteroides pseudotrichonymphae]